MINSKKTINKKNGHNIKAGNKHSGENKIVLVGLMGAGKTSIGRRLATRLRLPFSDADDEGYAREEPGDDEGEEEGMMKVRRRG